MREIQMVLGVALTKEGVCRMVDIFLVQEHLVASTSQSYVSAPLNLYALMIGAHLVLLDGVGRPRFHAASCPAFASSDGTACIYKRGQTVFMHL